MKKNILIQFIIFIVAFLVIFLIPKPDLRIEKIRSKVGPHSNQLIVGNSILEHQSPCENKRQTISKKYEYASTIGEGGLLLEEVYLSLVNNQVRKKLILIAAPYQFSQDLYYPLLTHTYYAGNQMDNLNLSIYPIVKKNLWRLDESILVNGIQVNRGEASLEIKRIFSKNRCGSHENGVKSLLNAIFIHSSNNFRNETGQFNLIKRINDTYDLSVILVPVYLDDTNSSEDTRKKAIDQLIDIQNNLDKMLVKYEILNIHENIKYYDEPWCMCGHLSSSGREILENTIHKMLNDKMLQ